MCSFSINVNDPEQRPPTVISMLHLIFAVLKKKFSLAALNATVDLVFLSPAGLSSLGSDYSGVKVTVISVLR